MTVTEAVYLSAAAMAGAALNAVAGGGSFFAFPALIFSGVPVLNANATNTVALWPGAVSSAISLRKNLNHPGRQLTWLMLVSVAGSVLGTALLLKTPDELLRKLLPFLLLTATLILVFKNSITRFTARKPGTKSVLIIQFVIAIYGGYFGGGIGILMLATFSLMGFKDLLQMNALKALLGGTINGVAVVLFVCMKIIYWPQAIVMIVSAIIGGMMGSWILSRINTRYLHGFIICTGLFFTIWFFCKEYL